MLTLYFLATTYNDSPDFTLCVRVLVRVVVLGAAGLFTVTGAVASALGEVEATGVGVAAGVLATATGRLAFGLAAGAGVAVLTGVATCP